MVMRKEKSWTRIQYEQSYRYMRRGFDFGFLSRTGQRPTEVIKAADYSYQAKDYVSDAWLSEARYSRFFSIKWRILSQREVDLF